MKKEVLFGSIAVSLALMAACGRKVENPGNSQTPPSVAPVPPKQLVCTKKEKSVDISPINPAEAPYIDKVYKKTVENLETIGLGAALVDQANQLLNINEFAKFDHGECSSPDQFICMNRIASKSYNVSVLKRYSQENGVYIQQMTILTAIVEIFLDQSIPVKQDLIDKVNQFKSMDLKSYIPRGELTKEEYYDIMYGLNNESDEVCEYK